MLLASEDAQILGLTIFSTVDLATLPDMDDLVPWSFVIVGPRFLPSKYFLYNAP